MNNDNGNPDEQDASEALKQLTGLLENLVQQARTTGWALPRVSSSETTTQQPGTMRVDSAASTQPEQKSVSSLMSSFMPGVQSFLSPGQGLTGLTGAARGSWWSSLLSPVLGGLLGLFRGGDEDKSMPPVPYIRPSSLAMDYAWTGGGEQDLLPFDYDSAGRPRPVAPENRPAQTPITIQVQAMDSRSFLDHRDDIADAVRRALLESHPLNDTLSEV